MNPSIIQNNYNKMILLNEIDRNNILATILNKGSDLLPTHNSEFSIGNEFYKWNKIYINEIINKDSIKIIANSLKSNYDTKICIASNGMALDTINFHAPYGGITINTGRPCNINGDLLLNSDIVHVNSTISIDMKTNNTIFTTIVNK